MPACRQSANRSGLDGLVGPPQPGEQVEAERQQHADHRGQGHALELHRTELDGHVAGADDEHHRGERQVGRPGVVDPGFDQHAHARGGDHPEQQQADPAHHRRGDGLDERW